MPSLVVEASEAVLRFPERDDKVQRGLEYVVQFSDDLVSWTTALPDGASTSVHSFTPPIGGFVEREIRWPASDPQRFVRVGVTLAE